MEYLPLAKAPDIRDSGFYDATHFRQFAIGIGGRGMENSQIEARGRQN